MRWIYPTVLICLYGFFKEMKPSEPFLTPYLRGPPKNFTEKELENEVYPVWTYSYLVALFIVFFITDYLRYKPVIIVEAIAYLGTRVLLIWGTSVLSMQLMQVTYGVATGAEVAYYSYIYAAVSSTHYQKVTGYTRAAILTGRMMSGVLGQLLVSLNGTSYLTLNYISFASICVSLVLALILPHVSSTAVAFSRIDAPVDLTQEMSAMMKFRLAWKAYFVDFWEGFKHCYSKELLLRWSIWWALATCGEFQVENYVQNLWDMIRSPHQHRLYNGGVTAVAHFLAALIAFLLAFPRINWATWGELCLAVLSVVDCFVIFIMTATKNVWIAYCCYVIFRIIYTFLITIASLQIARVADMNRFGLVFGCNMFASLVLQTILTTIVADKHGLALSAKDQFVVYACYFGIIGALFLAISVYSMTKIGWRTCWRHRYLPAETEEDDTNESGQSNLSHLDEYNDELPVV